VLNYKISNSERFAADIFTSGREICCRSTEKGIEMKWKKSSPASCCRSIKMQAENAIKSFQVGYVN
jgi:hypothetical protein